MFFKLCLKALPLLLSFVCLVQARAPVRTNCPCKQKSKQTTGGSQEILPKHPIEAKQIASGHLNQSSLPLYFKRANANFYKKNYQVALKDYKIISSYLETNPSATLSDLLEAICGCLFCYQCLDEEDYAKEEFDKLVYYVSLAGNQLDNVEWFKNGPFYSTYKKNTHSKAGLLLVDLPAMTPEEFCEFQCAGYAVAVSSACLKVPNPALAATCAGCIWGLERLCSRCCKGSGFWENCVKPLRRLFYDPEHPNNPAPHPFE